jgi:hypothetical protein
LISIYIRRNSILFDPYLLRRRIIRSRKEEGRHCEGIQLPPNFMMMMDLTAKAK